MSLDQDRLRLILNKELSYYGAHQASIRKDGRLNLAPSEFLANEIQPTMHLLDIGCGSGDTLLALHQKLAFGVGVDNDPAHIQIAQEAKREIGVENVNFYLMSFPEETDQLGLESFDVILSNLGPVGDSPAHIQAALRLLKPDGLILCAEIGELHQPEVGTLFGTPPHINQVVRRGEQLRTWMIESGVDIRLTADMFAKWYYPDIYAWFHYQCSLWTWLGVPLPEPDDPRLELFAKRNTTPSGEIQTTHHVVWVAGVKPSC